MQGTNTNHSLLFFIKTQRREPDAFVLPMLNASMRKRGALKYFTPTVV
jgi:hypothetical protein